MPPRQPDTPKPAKKPLRKSIGRRSDVMIAGAGLALGLTCALFPWYIFLNPDKFGPPSVRFSGATVEAISVDAMSTPVMPRGGSDVRIVGIPELDYSGTGSVPESFSAGDVPSEQPFPDNISPFKVLHVTAGRAMIEDDTGIWVVQRGSELPDHSRVEKIEQREGKWVLVTTGKVLSATN
jgi:hypothetical protein